MMKGTFSAKFGAAEFTSGMIATPILGCCQFEFDCQKFGTLQTFVVSILCTMASDWY